MTDQEQDGSSPAVRMILLRINETYWLYEGRDFLNEMLWGQGGYPVPITCINFTDGFALRRFLGDRPITDFWGINPGIVDRLRQNDELIDVEPPDLESDAG